LKSTYDEKSSILPIFLLWRLYAPGGVVRSIPYIDPCDVSIATTKSLFRIVVALITLALRMSQTSSSTRPTLAADNGQLLDVVSDLLV